MYNLAYISSASETLIDEEQLKTLLENSQRNNEALSITGMLLYFDGNIIQMIEGEKQHVIDLYKKIQRDSRHSNIIKLFEGNIDQRNFSNWSMGFKSLNSEELTRITGYKDISRNTFLETELSGSKNPAVVLLRSFYSNSRL